MWTCFFHPREQEELEEAEREGTQTQGAGPVDEIMMTSPFQPIGNVITEVGVVVLRHSSRVIQWFKDDKHTSKNIECPKQFMLTEC